VPENTRFFLGYGQRLTERVAPPGGGGGPEPAYSFGEAVLRLRPMVQEAVHEIQELPQSACPRNEAVGVVTLHPQWMAKSYHPQELLDEYQLRQVGSRPVAVQPEKWTRRTEPEPTASTELYLAGKRESFVQWADELEISPSHVSDQIRRLEAVHAPDPEKRIRGFDAEQVLSTNAILLEVVLHASNDLSDQYILAGFDSYAHSLNASANLDRRFHVGGLCFVPVEAAPEVVPALARFAFLRVARPMPRLRDLTPIERSVPSPELASSPLPDQDAVDPDLRVAIFDGGLDPSTPFSRWATPHEARGVGAPAEQLIGHGHDVTSAALFGPLVPGQPAMRPFSVVDHYRVLDKQSGTDPYDLYDALRRVDEMLGARQYEFFNLSIGPAVPIEDDEVHPWTALLDEHLSDGHALATVAVGNNGREDRPSGEARIQVPSDAVNGLAVGAADSTRDGWKRAPYSAFGPGRSPGRVKPEVLQFGGDSREPFRVYDMDAAPGLASTMGTSFAAPAALRLATGVRAHFGSRISPLALKALLVNSADQGDEARDEVGWGRVSPDLDGIVLCDDGMVRVLYQGELNPSQYLRALIPLPNDEYLNGYVTIESTFCYATPTDPQDPGSYTRSGLEITFRPHVRRFSREDATVPQSQPFFKKSDFDNEHVLRNDAQKWETTVHASRRFRGTSLLQPVFDVHYNARSSGGAAREAKKIRYALVVTVRSPRTPNLYDNVLRAYAGQLEALLPIIDIPVRV
jgi:Subtilase family